MFVCSIDPEDPLGSISDADERALEEFVGSIEEGQRLLSRVDSSRERLVVRKLYD